MHRYAFPTPISPGHGERELLTALEPRPGAGIHLERIYAGPHWSVTYLETDWDCATTLRALAGTAATPARELLAELAAQPAPELIGEWLDPAITKRRPGLAVAFEVRPGAEPALRQFADDAFHHRRYEHTLSRRALPITVERLFLAGDRAVFYVEADDPAAAYEQLGASQSVHDVWFKGRCRELLAGVALDEPLPAIATIADRDLEAVPA